MATEASTSHTTDVATTSTTAAPAQAAPVTEEHADHKKHGLGAVIDKIVHPHGHGGDHKEHKEDTPSVQVAVPHEASDGQAHLAPGGSGVGGIL